MATAKPYHTPAQAQAQDSLVPGAEEERLVHTDALPVN